jgi:ornithine cyclodeaminase/alanine dehydrogenase-like protein (mu-crystallin family)
LDKAVVTFVSESDSTRLISHESAFEAVRKALIAAASADAKVFPAVIAHASDPRNTFSLKSGSTPELAGLKVGSFWPDNPAKGRPRHSSTIFLIGQDNGRIGAVVEASTANAYRTGAADAVAADALARPDSETLAMFGAGNQALFECCALAPMLFI